MDFNQQLTNLTDGTVVLTSTERVARFVRMQISGINAARGAKAWFDKTPVHTVTNWIEETWLSQMPNQQLLYPVQELAVTKAVTDSSGLLPETIISSTSTARKVNQAFALVKKFDLPVEREQFLFKPEFEVFYQWHQMIEEVCAKRGWVYRAHLPNLLKKAIQAGEVTVPERILVVGILQLNPAERELFDVVRQHGCSVEFADHAFEPAEARLVRPHSQADEYTEVAHWVSENLLPYAEAPLSAPSMAILVPDIRKHSAPLIDALSLITAPTVLMPNGDGLEMKTPWDVSSGAALGARPVIRTAMDMLSITCDEADSEVFSRILRSRWIYAPDSEVSDRAVMDIWIRENLGLSMGGKDFMRAMAACKKASAPSFRERFGEVMARRAAEQELLPSDWATEFTEVLNIMGWPGNGELDSANFQTLKAWDEALTLFRTLDGQLGSISYTRAFMWLREIVDTRQFQPRISHQAPVSIMSFEEAVGLHWEKVWVIGASSTALPAPASPSPFIPTQIQATAGVPEANGELALERAKLVVDALLRTGSEVVVSCPEIADKGVALGQCDLFGAWPESAASRAGRGAFIDNLVGELDRTQFEEEVVPQVGDEEIATLKGGIAIFKDYAEAPFFSFAKHRLQAQQFPEPIVGLDPRIQGTTVHQVLEVFWREVKNSWTLKAMDQDELTDKVLNAVAEAAEKRLNMLVWRYGSRIIQLEKMRLLSLTLDWLELEKKRELEFEVIGFEVRHEIDVWGVPVTVVIDRHDRIFLDDKREDFRDIVIDYKTGATVRFKGLNATSLNEPQLPIYATRIDFKSLLGKPLDGIALAQVNPAAMGIHVRSNFTGALLPRNSRKGDVDTAEAWGNEVHAWDRVLEEMAQGFLGGNAEMQIGHYPMGYEYLAPLAR